LEPDIEDIVDDNPSDRSSHTHKQSELFVSINSKQVHKASVLYLYSHPHTQPSPGSTDRLKHVHGFKHYKEPDALSAIEEESLFGTLSLMVNDPAMTLLHCNNEVVLALIQISGIKVDGHSAQLITLTSLHLPTTCIIIQVLKLMPCEPTPIDLSDWSCDASMARMEKENSLLDVSGSLIEVVNPLIVPSEADISLLNFATNKLPGITALLHQCVLDNAAINILTVKATADFPYQVEDVLVILYNIMNIYPLMIVIRACMLHM
jgi:hypothetical protein